MLFRYNAEKNIQLKEERGISFEDIIYYIESAKVVAVINHPNQDKYPSQYIYLVNIDNYIYVVPFIRESEDVVFLKTRFPSRSMTKLYLSEEE